MEGEYDHAYSEKRILWFNHEHKDITNISHRKIQVSKSNG
jgi:hypothetical protein